MSANPSQFSFLFTGTSTVPAMKAESYLPPRSRASDPESSKRAEAELKQSGQMTGQRMIALRLIEKHPGKTASELAEIHCPLDSTERFKTVIFLRKRLPELREMRLARTTQAGSEDLRWWPKETE